VIIISHRGYWKTPNEKNKSIAFQRSFQLGFGTETDLRDYKGEIAISHDMANENNISFDDFLLSYKMTSSFKLPLALNIKADGLQSKIKAIIENHKVQDDCFVFDMSIPDTIGYMNSDIRFFSRQSEYEREVAFYDKCAGIWLDAFNNTWYNEKVILEHIGNGKQVAIVSAELHKREKEDLWFFLKEKNIHKIEGVILCTDMPEEATGYFE
jgi:hypothetical protein